MNSVISDTPGPEVQVNARAPFQPAPTTTPIDAISSSACTMAYLFCPLALSTRYRLQYFWNASAADDDGVIGYQAQTVAPPYTQPSATAALPSTKMRLPTASQRCTFSPRMSSTPSSNMLRPCCRPIMKASRFASISLTLPLYCSPSRVAMISGSMPSRADSTPT